MMEINAPKVLLNALREVKYVRLDVISMFIVLDFYTLSFLSWLSSPSILLLFPSFFRS